MNRYYFTIFALGAAIFTLQACLDERVPMEPRAGGVLAASVASPASAGRHIVVFAAQHVAADFAERVAELGGSVEASLDGIGAAVVTDLSDAAAAELTGSADIRSVEPDPVVSMSDDVAEAADVTAELADAAASPTLASFYAR